MILDRLRHIICCEADKTNRWACSSRVKVKILLHVFKILRIHSDKILMDIFQALPVLFSMSQFRLCEVLPILVWSCILQIHVNTVSKMTVQQGRSSEYNGTFSAGNKKKKIDFLTSQSSKNNTARLRRLKSLSPLDKSGHDFMPVNCVKPLVAYRYKDDDILIWSCSMRQRSPVLLTWNAYYETDFTI